MSAKLKKDGTIEALCDCGKPLVMVNKYGMFCEDKCGHEESIKAKNLVENLIMNLDKWVEKDKCPHCESEDVEPVHPFDYVKQCNKCGKQFAGSHN